MRKLHTARCSLCGKELTDWDRNEDISIHKALGYGSKYDGETVHVQFCCDCFDSILDKCKEVVFE